MRIQLKGGIWKNTEDEILKAAVMKYGLNQWARISSLLVRKTAKQCKGRWFEWLDPSIKKTEWTREEDEKLLHLAKLMPCQWRTIAPIVGRTPTQCLERYEKLLDMAVSKEERYNPADDPRRLRPGEIDPSPESKPARPDPIDMDEDEKEMLSEARARLANTRGKKAKRKAREKSLEEARRLAALQKQRELVAAGIELRTKFKSKRGIDYNAEVAFEKKPAAGFFDTGEEVARTREVQQEFRPVTIEELEGRKRKDIEEQLVKQDMKRQKLQERHDMPTAVAKANELNAIAMLPRRGKLMLPAPQVSEAELEAIARSGAEGMAVDEELGSGAGGEATRALLGQYGQTPAHFATPMRTPRTAPSGDRLRMEAENLARMNAMPTPLAGGDNPELHPSDFTGATPRLSAMAATPNPLASGMTPLTGSLAGAPQPTPGRGAMMAIAGAPASVRGAGAALPGATPRATPMRDELGLNLEQGSLGDEGKGVERARQMMLRNELRSGLIGLPAAKNAYALVVPEIEEEDEMAEGDERLEEDAADMKARRLREAAAAREAEERKKSHALQRQLPRPLSLDAFARQAADVSGSKQGAGLRQQAEAVLLQEMLVLLQHDAAKYPIKAKGDKTERRKGALEAALQVEAFELPELQAAARLLQEEADALESADGGSNPEALGEEYLAAWSQVQRDMIWLPSQERYGRAASATNSDRVESLQRALEGVRGQMDAEAKRGVKLEAKVAVVLGGLQAREAKLRGSAGAVWEELQSARLELACFQALRAQELRAAPERIEALMELLAAQEAAEKGLQERFKELSRQRSEAAAALAAKG